jgi:hypothetical protein
VVVSRSLSRSAMHPRGDRALCLWLNRVQCLHSSSQVPSHVTMKQLCTRIVGSHVGSEHAHRQQSRDIGAHVLNDDRVAMPMRRVQFEVAGRHEIPADRSPTFMVKPGIFPYRKPFMASRIKKSKGVAELPVRMPRTPVGAEMTRTFLGSPVYRSMFSCR